MKNLLEFTGKVALVTGAASGMRLATAQAFAEAGASVALAGVRDEFVRAEAGKLKASGHRVTAIRCGVSDDSQVMARIAPTAEGTHEEWDRVIGVNRRGVWSSITTRR